MTAHAAGQRVYVKNSYLPFEEDETHEFKGHRNIAVEDLPKWVHQMTPDYRQTRKSVSRNLNGFLNTGRGGVVYLGVDDAGRVLGLHLTRFQKDHVLLSVRDTFRRYRPPVGPERYTVTFVPVVGAEGAVPPKEYRYEKGQRRKQHRVATDMYCWCEAECKARAHMGQIPMDYVVEVRVLPWHDWDRLHPFHLTESGRCYIRRSASLVQLTALEVVQLTHHQAAAVSRRQEAAMLRELRQLLRAADGAADGVTAAVCRCGEVTGPAAGASDARAADGSDSGAGTCSSLVEDLSSAGSPSQKAEVAGGKLGNAVTEVLKALAVDEGDKSKKPAPGKPRSGDAAMEVRAGDAAMEARTGGAAMEARTGGAAMEARTGGAAMEARTGGAAMAARTGDEPSIMQGPNNPSSSGQGLDGAATGRELGGTVFSATTASWGVYAASSAGDLLLSDDGPVMDLPVTGTELAHTDTGDDSTVVREFATGRPPTVNTSPKRAIRGGVAATGSATANSSELDAPSGRQKAVSDSDVLRRSGGCETLDKRLGTAASRGSVWQRRKQHQLAFRRPFADFFSSWQVENPLREAPLESEGELLKGDRLQTDNSFIELQQESEGEYPFNEIDWETGDVLRKVPQLVEELEGSYQFQVPNNAVQTCESGSLTQDSRKLVAPSTQRTCVNFMTAESHSETFISTPSLPHSSASSLLVSSLSSPLVTSDDFAAAAMVLASTSAVDAPRGDGSAESESLQNRSPDSVSSTVPTPRGAPCRDSGAPVVGDGEDSDADSEDSWSADYKPVTDYRMGPSGVIYLL